MPRKLRLTGWQCQFVWGTVCWSILMLIVQLYCVSILLQICQAASILQLQSISRPSVADSDIWNCNAGMWTREVDVFREKQSICRRKSLIRSKNLKAVMSSHHSTWLRVLKIARMIIKYHKWSSSQINDIDSQAARGVHTLMMAMLLLQLTNPSSVLAFASFTSSFPSSSLLPIASQAPVMHKMINHVQHLLGQPKQNNQNLSKTNQAVKNNCYLDMDVKATLASVPLVLKFHVSDKIGDGKGWVTSCPIEVFVDTQRLNTSDTVWPTLLVRHTVDRGALLYHVQGRRVGKSLNHVAPPVLPTVVTVVPIFFLFFIFPLVTPIIITPFIISWGEAIVLSRVLAFSATSTKSAWVWKWWSLQGISSSTARELHIRP